MTHTLTVEEAFMSRNEILNRIIQFLGSLGSEAKYMSKSRRNEEELRN